MILLLERNGGKNKDTGPLFVVGRVNPVLGTCMSAPCQCPAFAQNLPPGRGASSPTHWHRRTTGTKNAPSGCSTKGVSVH